MRPPHLLIDRHTLDFAPPDHLLEGRRISIAPDGSLLPHSHRFAPGEDSTPSNTYPPIMGPPAMYPAPRHNDGTSNVPNASNLSTHESSRPTTSAPRTMYPISFSMSNEISPEFQEVHIPHQPQDSPTICSPSTECSLSPTPTVSSSPLAPSCSGPSYRYSDQLEPSYMLSKRELRVYARPEKRPAATYEPDPSKLRASCELCGGTDFACQWISTVFKDGVTQGALLRRLTLTEIERMNFPGGFTPSFAYDGFFQGIDNGFECCLCPVDNRVRWKNKKDAVRHLRKFHFGLADLCATWYVLYLIIA